jgi:hypothetical protein
MDGARAQWSRRGGAAGIARLSLTVGEQGTRWPVRRRGEGGGTWSASNRVVAVHRCRNVTAETAASSGERGEHGSRSGFPKGMRGIASEEEKGGRGAGVASRSRARRVTDGHAEGVTGMRLPRGWRVLPRRQRDARAGAGGGSGHADAGRAAALRERTRGEAWAASADGLEGWRRPASAGNCFHFYFSREIQIKFKLQFSNSFFWASK